MNVNKPSRVVVLTGAGASSESGLATMNSGIWKNYDLMSALSVSGFQSNPLKAQAFFDHLRDRCSKSDPNQAHYALADIEDEFDSLIVITQNIDDLHDKAGSTKVINMHGSLYRFRCMDCNKVHNSDKQPKKCPACKASNLRPDVVLMGEEPLMLKEIREEISKCQLFVSIGTSETIHPASSFVHLANRLGACTVQINLTQTPNSKDYRYNFYGKAGDLTPRFFELFM